jgi:plastocyanin
MKQMVHVGTMLAALAVLGACGGSGGDGGGGSNPVVTIAIAGAPNGDAQTATVATAVTDSLRVLVKEDNIAQAGVTVSWSSTVVGASLSPAASATDGNGFATSSWTLGNVAGAQTASATLSGAAGSPVTFNATATAGPPFNLSMVSGSGQTAILNGNFANQLRVLVTDQFDNPVQGVAVNFAGSGGIMVDNPTTNTGINGTATATIIGAATAGPGGVSATVVGIGSPVNFTLTTANAVREVTVGAGITFKSERNSTVNPAVDTIATGQGVLWRWEGGNHSVESTSASPNDFASSPVSNTVGNLYTVVFPSAGTFQYDCGVHLAGMTGRVVVQ